MISILSWFDSLEGKCKDWCKNQRLCLMGVTKLYSWGHQLQTCFIAGILKTWFLLWHWRTFNTFHMSWGSFFHLMILLYLNMLVRLKLCYESNRKKLVSIAGDFFLNHNPSLLTLNTTKSQLWWINANCLAYLSILRTQFSQNWNPSLA